MARRGRGRGHEHGSVRARQALGHAAGGARLRAGGARRGRGPPPPGLLEVLTRSVPIPIPIAGQHSTSEEPACGVHKPIEHNLPFSSRQV